MATYVYQQLDSSTEAIRVLRLRKSTSFHAEIRTELIQTTIGQVPFEALSYTWGTMDKPCHITVDGYDLSVTQNVYDALHYLRLPFEDRLLWIDAICINQDDSKERGHQVGQMRFIYECAERVLIWLGTSDPGIDELFKTLNTLGCLPMMGDDLMCDSRSSPANALFSGVLKHHHILAFKRIMKTDWFRRIWVLQETASARAAVVLCGGNAVSTRLFTRVPTLFSIRIPPHCQVVLDIMPGQSRKQSWWADRRDLRTLLSKFSASEATDERDKVYALLGICSDRVDASMYIDLDYTKSYDEVAQDVVAYYFHHIMDLPLVENPPKVNLKDIHVMTNYELTIKWILQLDRDSVISCGLEGNSGRIETTPNDLLLRLFHPKHRKKFDMMAYLCYLAEEGYEDVFQTLLESSEVDFGIPDQAGDTVLHRAVTKWSDAQIEKLLSRQDVDANKQNIYGVTPVFLAFMMNRKTLTEKLIERDGFDIGLKAQVLYGRFAIGGFLKIIQISTPWSRSNCSLHEISLWDWSKPLNTCYHFHLLSDHQNRRQFMNMYRSCETATGKLRVDASNPNILNIQRISPVSIFRDLGSFRPYGQFEWSDERDESMLDIAIASGCHTRAKFILEEANRRGHAFEMGKSLLRAVSGRQFEMVRLLLSNGAPINHRDITFRGLTALQIALELQDYEITTLLVNMGANVEGHNWELQTAAACARDSSDLTKVALKSFANLNSWAQITSLEKPTNPLIRRYRPNKRVPVERCILPPWRRYRETEVELQIITQTERE